MADILGAPLEMACGSCAGDSWRVMVQHGEWGAHDVALVCQGCGSVTHLVPRTHISVEWGRAGEKADGVMAPMPWGATPRKTEDNKNLHAFWSARGTKATIGASAASELRNLATILCDGLESEDLEIIRGRLGSLARLLGDRK